MEGTADTQGVNTDEALPLVIAAAERSWREHQGREDEDEDEEQEEEGAEGGGKNNREEKTRRGRGGMHVAFHLEPYPGRGGCHPSVISFRSFPPFRSFPALLELS